MQADRVSSSKLNLEVILRLDFEKEPWFPNIFPSHHVHIYTYFTRTFYVKSYH